MPSSENLSNRETGEAVSIAICHAFSYYKQTPLKSFALFLCAALPASVLKENLIYSTRRMNVPFWYKLSFQWLLFSTRNLLLADLCAVK